MTGPVTADALQAGAMRSALLRLSTRIAESPDEEQICRGVAEGLMHQVFGFDGVGLFLGGTDTFTPTLAASAGRFQREPDGLAELRLSLRADQSAIGELVVQRAGSGAFTQGDLEILAAATTQASIAIGRVRLLAAERQRTSEQRALLDTLADLSSELQLDALLEAVLNRAVALLGVSGGELAVFDETRDELVIVAAQGIGKESVGTRMKRGDGGMGHVASTHEPLMRPEPPLFERRSGPSRASQGGVPGSRSSRASEGQKGDGRGGDVRTGPSPRRQAGLAPARQSKDAEPGARRGAARRPGARAA